MAAILLDNIINQTIHNSILQDSFLKVNQNDLLASPGASNQVIRDTQAGRLQLEREDRILSSGLTPDDQLDTSLTQSLQQQNVDMSQYERLFWVLIFSIMVLVAAGGNTIVVYIVSTNKEMKSVTNYFLVNLSFADTMVSILNVVFNFTSMLISHWPFGKIYCKISNFIAILSISASVFTLTAISCDRYNAILHPLRPRMSHSHALGWILLIWTLSSALAIPNAIYSSLVEDRLANDNTAITCTMIWPDGRYPLSSYDHIYNIIILVVTYLVPIFTMAILYYRVGKELWGYEAIGENIDKQQRSIMAKKKIVKMMIVVVIIFALCWLPYHAFFVVNYYVPTIFQDVPLHYQRCYLIMYWMAMSNSMYNPIIIYFMNSKFRHEFRKILYRVCCCRTYIPPMRANTEINNNITATNHYTHNSTINSNRISMHQQTKRQITQETRKSSRSFVKIDNYHQNFTQEAQENDNNNNKVKIVVTKRTIGDSCGDNKLSRISSGGSETTNNQSSGTIKIIAPDQETDPFIAAEASVCDLRITTTATATNSHNNLNSTNEKLIDLYESSSNVRHPTVIESSSLKVWI